jgi:endonuclease VIII
MPEGDALHRAAERLRVLEGEIVTVETPHPRAAVLRLPERLDGLRLERVQAVGKNLLLSFEGGLLLRSHLRMHGRWRVQAAGTEPHGTPWLVLRGSECQAVLWNGPVLELKRGRSPAVARLGPDVLADPPDEKAMIARLRGAGPSRQVGDALLDQRLLAGVGNMWKAEILFEAGISPWRPIGELSDDDLARIVGQATRLMRTGRRRHRVYRRAGLPCRVCGAGIRSYPQGDEARMAYWCPGCQGGTGPAGA